jgi:hypothetical protein
MERDGGNVKVKWWDWLFSPPPAIVFLLLVDTLVQYLASDPCLEQQMRRYTGYIFCLVTVLWSLSWWKRFGWKAPLPGKLTAFWIAVMLVWVFTYVVVLELVGLFHG